MRNAKAFRERELKKVVLDITSLLYAARTIFLFQRGSAFFRERAHWLEQPPVAVAAQGRSVEEDKFNYGNSFSSYSPIRPTLRASRGRAQMVNLS